MEHAIINIKIIMYLLFVFLDFTDIILKDAFGYHMSPKDVFIQSCFMEEIAPKCSMATFWSYLLATDNIPTNLRLIVFFSNK